jgi:hypothetical protein
VNFAAKPDAIAPRSARWASTSSIRASHSTAGVHARTRAQSSGVASGTPPIAEASTGTPSAWYSSAATQNVSMNPGMTRVGNTPTAEAARRHWASCELMLGSTVRFGSRSACASRNSASDPVPAMTNSYPVPSSAVSSATSISVSRPFSGARRPSVETSTESWRRPARCLKEAMSSGAGCAKAAGGKPGYRSTMDSASWLASRGPPTASAPARNRSAV